MKALFVTSSQHFDSTGGAATHTRGILSIFSDIADVEVLTLPMPLRRLPHALKKFRAIGLGLASRQPAKSCLFLDRKNTKAFRGAVRSKAYDLVVINHSDLLPLSRHVPDQAKTVLISHNIESNIVQGEIDKLRAPRLLKRFLETDVRTTAQAERRLGRSLDLILPISRDDQSWYRKNVPDVDSLVVPTTFPGKPYEGERPAIGKTLRLAWLGNLNWWPNREGVDWLVESVLPRVPNDGGLEIHFYGAGTQTLSSPCSRVFGHGAIPDLETIWRFDHVALCPVLSGSGINVKLAEALFNRVPVLGTPHAYRGLPQLDDPALAMIDTDDWPAFLSSQRLREMAAEQVTEATSALFSKEQYSSLIRSVLQN